MSIKKDYKGILKTVAAYRQKLSAISDEQWQLTPPIGGWTYSEVYFHIFDASILTLYTLTEAAKGKGIQKDTHFIAKLILFAGILPPGKRFKAPKLFTERLKAISKDEAAALISQLLTQLEAIMPGFKDASKTSKTKHPRMGYFNAFQWLRFARIHLDHHLKQLNRMEKSF